MEFILSPFLTLATLEEEERRSLRNNIVRPSRMKSFELPEREFISLFRLNKQLTVKLIELLRPALEPKDCRRNVISVEAKVSWKVLFGV
jgi:hypothetical protein